MNTSHHSHRVAVWNANGLGQRISEVEAFLTHEKIDICLIAETHSTRTSVYKINGYRCYHTPHPSGRGRGGSAIFVKETIKHYEQEKIEKDTMQITTISVSIKNREFNISAIYCPPRHSLRKEDYLELLVFLGNHFILGGDFNAKHPYWGSRLTTAKGKALFDAGKSLSCEFFSSGTPTYWPTDTGKTPDLIDFFVGKGISSNYIHVRDSGSLMSDHSAIVMTLSDDIVQKNDPPTLVNRKTDWQNFKTHMEEGINLGTPLRTVEQLEDETASFVRLIQQAAWAATPAMDKKRTVNTVYPLEIRELISKKRRARKRWQRTRAPQDKEEMNRLSNQLRAAIREMKNETFTRYINSLTAEKDTEYSLWKASKGLKRPQAQNSPIKADERTWARSDKQKADLFAAHLAETFKPFPRQTMDENINLTNVNADADGISPVTFSELESEIKNLKTRKAPGFDLITGQVVKQLPEKAKRKLLYLINATFRLRCVPTIWKVAEVIMILKPGKEPTEAKSYRPISLLPVLSKLMEKLLLKRLKILIDQRNLIPDHQFGFREQHSTIDQVHRIASEIEKALENKKVCSAVFLDVAQAFDKVWHGGLEYKLQRDLPTKYFEILKSYINGRHFRVKHEEEYSSLKSIDSGVPQGSVLGPILYLLYTRDLPPVEDGVTATFADDTALIAVADTAEESANMLQSHLDKVSRWTKQWRIRLNEAKSAHVNFTYKKDNVCPITLNSQIIPYANTAKYLGMTLDSKLKWKEHIKIKKNELNIKFRKMYWLLGRHSELEIHNKLLLYKQILKPVWTYGIQLWGCTKKSNAKMIQKFQNKVLRNIVNAPWYIRNDDLHRDLRMETVSEEITRYAAKHEERLHRHVNIEMLQLLDNSETVRRLDRTKPFDLGIMKHNP